MTVLGLDQKSEEEQELKPGSTSLRQDIFRRFLLGGGTAGGAALVLGAFELLHQQPHEGFQLLENWGPKFLLWIVGMYFAWDILRQMIQCLWRLVKAMEGVSTSMHTIAAKDDVRARENEILLDHLNSQCARVISQGDDMRAFFADEVRKMKELISEEARTTRKVQGV